MKVRRGKGDISDYDLKMLVFRVVEGTLLEGTVERPKPPPTVRKLELIRLPENSRNNFLPVHLQLRAAHGIC